MLVPTAAQADESLWIYTKGSETLPKGKTELKFKGISKRGKADSDYVFNDLRFEVEHGVTNRLTLYGEIIVFNHNYSTTNPDLQPFYDTQGGEGGRFRNTAIGGFELGGKYNILSPYKDPIGLSTTLAYDHRFKYRIDGADINQDSIEFSIQFQKNLFNDQLILAFSPKIEWEHRLSPGIEEKEISLDLAAGISYRFAPKWFIGAEFRHQSDYLSPLDTTTGEYDPNLRPTNFPFDFGSQYQNGNYAGPTIHYAAKDWWATAGILWQFAGGGTYAFNRDGRNVDEHEKVHIGLILATEF